MQFVSLFHKRKSGPSATGGGKWCVWLAATVDLYACTETASNYSQLSPVPHGLLVVFGSAKSLEDCLGQGERFGWRVGQVGHTSSSFHAKIADETKNEKVQWFRMQGLNLRLSIGHCMASENLSLQSLQLKGLRRNHCSPLGRKNFGH